MSQIIHEGFLNNDTDPYLVIDNQYVVNNEASGVTYLNNQVMGASINKTTQSNSSSVVPNLSQTVPNPWAISNRYYETKIHSLNDAGVVVFLDPFGLDGDFPSYSDILGNGVVSFYTTPTYQYARIPKPTYGALLFTTNRTAQANDVNTIESTNYGDGSVRIKATWSSSDIADMHMLFHIDGSLFLFFIGGSQAKKPNLSFMSANSLLLNNIGDLSLNKVYCIRSTSVNMSGVVKNSFEQAAEGFTVMAFQRSTGRMVGKTTVNADGSYTMSCATVKGDILFAVCLDDDGFDPNIEGVVIDRIMV